MFPWTYGTSWANIHNGYWKIQLLIKDHSLCILFPHESRRRKKQHLSSALSVQDGPKELSPADTLILGSIFFSLTLIRKARPSCNEAHRVWEALCSAWWQWWTLRNLHCNQSLRMNYKWKRVSSDKKKSNENKITGHKESLGDVGYVSFTLIVVVMISQGFAYMQIHQIGHINIYSSLYPSTKLF